LGDALPRHLQPDGRLTLSMKLSCLAFLDSLPFPPRHDRLDRDSMNIYVGNLAYSVTGNDLQETFARFGTVTQANLITDKFTGDSKGFGFVEMSSNAEADTAIKALNGTALKGRNIVVNQAKPKTDRPSRPSYGSRY
jgi:RNA recognition motif-containing protein